MNKFSFLSPAQLRTKSVDLSLGMFSKTERRVKLLSTSITYAQSNLIMIIPPGRQRSAFSKLFTAFDRILWYTLSGVTSFILIITLIITKRQRRRRAVRDFILGRDNRTPVLNIVNTIVGLPMHRTPTRNFSRFLYTMFLLMWLIFRSLYQAVLYKNLQSADYRSPVQSLNESLAQDFVYFMVTSTQENIIYLPEVYNRRIIVSRNQSDDIISKRLTDPNTRAAFLADVDIVKYSNKIRYYGDKTAVICREPLLMRQLGIYYQHNSRLASLFNDMLLRLVDAGLIDYWREQLLGTTPGKVINEPRKLTIVHLLSAFELLGVCTAASTVVFVVELCSLKWQRFRTLF